MRDKAYKEQGPFKACNSGVSGLPGPPMGCAIVACVCSKISHKAEQVSHCANLLRDTDPGDTPCRGMKDHQSL